MCLNSARRYSKMFILRRFHITNYFDNFVHQLLNIISMSKLDDLVQKYMEESAKHKFGLKEDFLRAVAKSCGPSIYKTDSAKVSCSDKKELATVKNNFLIKKLGMKDTAKLDEAIADVCKQMGSSNRNKYRAIFYALLAKRVRKGAHFKK